MTTGRGSPHDIERLAAEVATLTAVVAGLGSLADKVTHLAERVSVLAAVRARDEAAHVSWFDATPEQAAALLTRLASWVDGELWSYRAIEAHVSDCWFRHPAAVEGLLTLQVAWQQAFRTPGASMADGVEWHHRHLPGIANLLREELAGCSESNHGPGGHLSGNLRPEARAVVPAAVLDQSARAWASRQ